MKSIMVEFGLNVKRYRIVRKMTQEDLAEKSGLDRTTIIYIETGKSNARLLTIATIASALNVHPSVLLETD